MMAGSLLMNDPLTGFAWNELHDTYVAKCEKLGKFNSLCPQLETFEDRPTSDRELYCRLVQRVSHEWDSPGGLSIGCYEALLYWKLYSQPAALANTCRRIRKEASIRIQIERGLKELRQRICRKPSRDPSAILAILNTFNGLEIHGTKDKNALPVRSVFVHFLYPDIVPIFDKMVLRAIGVDEDGANHKSSFFLGYVEHAWALEERYRSVLPGGFTETPLRLIEMALWVSRGENGNVPNGGHNAEICDRT
jgi:hypothetical protein